VLYLLVAGARPNLMKIAPVMREFEARSAECVLVHTGQHYDDEMSGVFFRDLGLRDPDHHLGVGSGSHGVQTARVMEAFEPLVEELRPDVVIVVGDVNSTLGCALVGAKSGARVAHVEAGLRSRDWTMPEEINRVVTDRVSDYLFAPSPDAVENLRAEGYTDDRIHLVGNVMVDTLLHSLERARSRTTVRDLGLDGRRYGLVTLHRPANVDDPHTLKALLGAFNSIARFLPLVFPVHPRTAARIATEGVDPSLIVTPPLGYLDFIALEASADLVLTDSGGVQEETTVLGVPCLTVRENTERPITIEQGTNTLVGRDPEVIVAEARRVLREGVPTRRPDLWDGRAAVRIVGVLMSGVKPPRPTELPA
jgi:UDP-N-acetylglucosamine 2-epimerase (non-hydrolysing)